MSGNYHWKIDFYEHGQGGAKHARVFSFPITTNDGPGRFFGFAASRAPSTTQALIDLADELAGQGEVRQPADVWFEKLLAAANRRYAEAQASGELPGEEEITACWGLQVRNSVSFAAHGNVHAYFLRKVPRNVQFNDINEGGTAAGLFGEVVTGALAPTDKLFFTAHELLNYLSLNHLQSILERKPDPINIITTELADVDKKIPIVSALMQPVKIDRAIRVPADGSAESIDELINKTRDTESWLSPPLLPSVKDVLNKAAQVVGNVTRRGEPPADDTTPKTLAPERPAAPPPAPPAKPAGQGTITRLFKDLPSTMGGLPEQIKRFATNMPGRARWILVGAAVLVLILVASIIMHFVNQSKSREQAAYTQAVADIQKKRNDIEATMIYNDEERAWKALDEARELLASLPQKTSGQKKTFEEITNQLNAQTDTLRRVARVTPEVVSNLPEVALPTPVALILRDGEAVVVDRVGLIAGFPLSGGAARVVSIIPNRTYSAAAADGKTIVLTNGAELYELTGDTLKRVDGPAILDVAPHDIAFWNRRLYAAVPEKNQIMRFSREGATWGARTNWVETPDPALNDVTAIDIDGSVWAVGSGGKVQKFTSGKREALTIKRIEPALSVITDIAVSPTKDAIYLFDAPGKRVLFLKKDGTLLAQYTAEWKEPRAFAVDEKAKFIYVLDGTTLTKFALP